MGFAPIAGVCANLVGDDGLADNPGGPFGNRCGVVCALYARMTAPGERLMKTTHKKSRPAAKSVRKGASAKARPAKKAAKPAEKRLTAYGMPNIDSYHMLR